MSLINGDQEGMSSMIHFFTNQFHSDVIFASPHHDWYFNDLMTCDFELVLIYMENYNHHGMVVVFVACDKIYLSEVDSCD